MSIKVDRIGSNLVKEISYILMTEVKNLNDEESLKILQDFFKNKRK